MPSKKHKSKISDDSLMDFSVVARQNPDLPRSFIAGILEALAEVDSGLIEELDRS